MKNRIFRVISLILSVVILTGSAIISSSAATASELQSQINALEQQSKKIEKEIAQLEKSQSDQKALKSAVEKKIANTQSQINLCNAEINSINAKIDANNAEIDQKNEEIADTKLAFKKRLRAIRMSNTGSSVQILLGAETFSDYLQLSQLVAAVSSHDKKMIDELVEEIKKIEEIQAANEALIEKQVSIRSTIQSKQAELESEGSRIQKVINNISSQVSEKEEENADIEADIKAYKNELNSLGQNTGVNLMYDGGDFLWPVSGGYISAGYQSNDPVHRGTHYGVDIARCGGYPIYAMADGYVYKSFNSCPHNYGKSGSCYSGGVRCGGGYGNYVAIDHGNSSNGTNYKAYYAHMSSATVSTGSYVKKGQVIGYVGSTGWSTGYHLHFGIMVNNSWVNPMNFFRAVR